MKICHFETQTQSCTSANSNVSMMKMLSLDSLICIQIFNKNVIKTYENKLIL